MFSSHSRKSSKLRGLESKRDPPSLSPVAFGIRAKESPLTMRRDYVICSFLVVCICLMVRLSVYVHTSSSIANRVVPRISGVMPAISTAYARMNCDLDSQWSWLIRKMRGRDGIDDKPWELKLGTNSIMWSIANADTGFSYFCAVNCNSET